MLKVISGHGNRTVCGDVKVNLSPSLLAYLGDVRGSKHCLLKSLLRDRIMDNLVACQKNPGMEELVRLKRAHQEKLDKLEADYREAHKRGDVHAEDAGNASTGEPDFGAWPFDSESHFLHDLENKQKMQRKLLKNAQTKELAEVTKRQQEALHALQDSPKTKKEDHRWEKELAQVTEQHSREIKQNQTTFTEQEEKQEKMQAEEKRAFQEWRDVMTRVHDKSEQDRLDVIPETERKKQEQEQRNIDEKYYAFWSKKEREVEIS